MEDEPTPKDMNQLYISSSDSLRNRRILQTIPVGWNDRPPLFMGRDDDQLLKGMIRRGIPPALRCAIWLSSVVKACHPHQPKEYAEDYRTLGKVRQLDYAWDSVLKQVFPNEGDELDALPPTFGNPHYLQHYGGGPLPDFGKLALTRVLSALSHVVGLDYAPLLPSLTVVSLSFMSESYAYAQLREMAHNSGFFFAVSQVEHMAWCRAFMDILGRLHPQTASALQKVIGRNVARGLDPIFKHFFLSILKFEHVLRIMDIYTLEGYKVLFRFGVALLCMFKKDRKDAKLTTAHEWWGSLKEYTHMPSFSIDTLVRKAYGYHGSRARRRLRFPRRHILARIIRLEEEKVEQECEFEPIASPTRPLPLVGGNGTLLKTAENRSNLAKWMPITLRLAKLELIFSTNVHGRTLERFYSHVSNYKHTVTVVEVLDAPSAVIGMFASQAWRESAQVYGDGECFLFRVSPTPQCFKWRPKAREDEDKLHEEDDSNNVALLEQFMVGRPNFISMGGNPDGSCGLRLNEDLTKGESSAAVGYGNEGPLIPGLPSFNVGLVEVYGLKG